MSGRPVSDGRPARHADAHDPGFTRRLPTSHQRLIPLPHDLCVTLATAIRSLRLRLVLPVLAAAVLLAAPSPAQARTGATVDQGVVQSVTATSISLTRLDGTTVTVSVDTGTVVRLNGRRSTILAVPPGAVARVTWTTGAAARLVQAVGTATARNDEGVILVSAPKRLVIRIASGESVTVRLGPGTVIRRGNGAVIARRRLVVGATVRASHVPGSPALSVVLLSRA